LSLKQPLTTEIQLRITVTTQPASPMKNMTSTTFIAIAPNLFAMFLIPPLSTESFKGSYREPEAQQSCEPRFPGPLQRCRSCSFFTAGSKIVALSVERKITVQTNTWQEARIEEQENKRTASHCAPMRKLSEAAYRLDLV
jgi:hypothetical protein